MQRRLRLTLVGMLLVMGCSGGGGGPGGPAGDTLEWDRIPSLVLSVGVPVASDLRAYLTDSLGTAVITLDQVLPAGLQWNDGMIAGTPTAETPSRQYVAAADNGVPGMAVSSDPFSIEVLSGSAGLTFELATPEQIGIYVRLANSPPADTTATVRYRPTGDPAWRTGHPLLRIRPEWNSGGAPVTPVDAFAGTIFDLAPGTPYDVEITITEPGSPPEVVQSVFSTRALPGPSGTANVHATPASDIESLINGLLPGDVIELAAGTYNVDTMQIEVSGTASEPIVIRGASRTGTVLRDSDGAVVRLIDASHIVIENLTIEGSRRDSGVAASSVGIDFYSGTPGQENVTIRRVTFDGVDQGVTAWDTVRSILVYECVFKGNNQWDQDFYAYNGAGAPGPGDGTPDLQQNIFWNDDGIRLPGEGNCAFDNTLNGFGDSFAVIDGTFSAAVYYYRNRIRMTGDDSFEGDYGTRNLAFYDNHIQNCGTLLSLDPLWGGPLYCFRNVAVNTVRGPFKWNSGESGFLVYNNTVIRTEGTTGWGWVQFNNGDLRGWSFRNNILVYHGGTSLLALEMGGNDPIDFTHNAWYPDGSVWWSNTGGSFSSIAEARSGLPATTPLFGTSTQRHEADRVIGPEPFLAAIPLGGSHMTEITSLFTPTLANASPARNAGVPIPNITDGHGGAAPDMGAIISGRPVPSWGAPP